MAKVELVKTSLQTFIKVDLGCSYEDLQIAQLADPSFLQLGNSADPSFELVLRDSEESDLNTLYIQEPTDVTAPYSMLIEWDNDISERITNATLKILQHRIDGVVDSVKQLVEKLESEE
jgi:nitrate/nitrite-specific signal transduction histidine kinase